MGQTLWAGRHKRVGRAPAQARCSEDSRPGPQIGRSGWPGRSPGSGVPVVKPGSAWPGSAQTCRAGAARALSSASNSGHRAAAARRCPDRTAGARHRVESRRRAAMPRASNHLHALRHESQLSSSRPNVTPLRRGGLEEGDAGRRKILPAGRGAQRAGLPGSATCRPAGGASETRKTDGLGGSGAGPAREDAACPAGANLSPSCWTVPGPSRSQYSVCTNEHPGRATRARPPSSNHRLGIRTCDQPMLPSVAISAAQ